MTPEPATKKIEPRAERVRTILGARAIFNGGRSAIDCQIRNMSETGAKLTLDEGLSLPPTFDLEVPARNKIFRVMLRWRTKDAAGVQFVDEGLKARAAQGDVADELVALRNENAALRRRVADLVRRLSDLGYSDWQR